MSDFINFSRVNWRWLLGGFLLTFFSGFGQTFFIALFAPEIKQTFGLSDGGWGWVYMLGTLCSALTLVYLGRIVDGRSIAFVTCLTCVCLALAAVFMALADGPVIVLIFAVFALRLFGQGMMSHIAMTAMGRWFVGNRGRAVSIAAIGHQGSEMVFPLSFVAITALIGWRNAWFLAALIIIVAMPFLFALMRVERNANSMEQINSGGAQKRQWLRSEMLRDPFFYMLMCGILAPPFIGTSIFFHQVHIMESKGLARELFAGGLGLMAAVTVVFVLVAGWLVDRYSAVRVFRYVLLPLALGCLILASFDTIESVLFFMVFMGVSYGFVSTLGGALLPEIYGTEHLGSIRAVLMAAMVFLTAAGPGLTGTLIDLGISFDQQLIYMAFYCFAVTFLMIFVSQQFLRRLASEQSTG